MCGRLLLSLGVLLVAANAYGDTFGSAVVQRSYDGTDACIGCLFAYAEVPAGDVGQTLDTWAFYDAYAADIGHEITPLLFLNITGTEFQIIGIGTTRTNTGTGVQSHPYGSVAGTDILGPNEYFGWRDGNVDGSVTNAGNVSLDLAGGPGLFYFIGPPYEYPGSIGVGGPYVFTQEFTTARTYSINATAVPEPMSIVLLGGIVLLMSHLIRQRKDRRGTEIAH